MQLMTMLLSPTNRVFPRAAALQSLYSFCLPREFIHLGETLCLQ